MIRFVVSLLFVCYSAFAVAETADMASAISSITSGEIRNHVFALADDTFEGREAGSRGGRAASLYVVQQLQKYGLKGGVNGGYYQPFGSYANVIAMLEGSDPILKNEYIVVGAHYDHVGYGNRRNSYGPTGFIHNGADDNASGVSGLLEVAQAFAASGSRPKRTVLFCFWDGEEKGLYGSKHWVESPTVPLKQVALAFNADMIGRLGKKPLEVFGIRTAPGLRKLVSLANDDPNLKLFFNWEIKENSDHYSFIEHNVPVVMFHTGLHNDYHRPSDDAEKVDTTGLQQVGRLLFRFIDRAADEPRLGQFRQQARQETPATQRQQDQPLPLPPGRLGLSWDPGQADHGKLVVTQVRPGSPAEKGGIRAGDQISEFAGRSITSAADFRLAVLVAVNPAGVKVVRTGSEKPLELQVELLGPPSRLGIAWRVDAGEPGVLIINRVIPGSPADVAGLKVNDRIYAAADTAELSTQSFLDLVGATGEALALTVENAGQVRPVTVAMPPKP